MPQNPSSTDPNRTAPRRTAGKRPAGEPARKPRRPKNPLARAFDTIRTHILLRNLILALCLGIVFFFLVTVVLNMYTRHGQKFQVPDFIGSTMEQARPVASQNGDLRLEIVDSLYMPKQRPGMILDQNPKPGMGVKSGRRVLVTVNAYRPRMEVLPYVTGYSLRQAKNILENKGFEIEQLIYKPDMATNNVIDQLYRGASLDRGAEVRAELGSGVTLVVGVNADAPMPRIPKVIGQTLREAKSRLWEAGLNVGNVKYDSHVAPADFEEARIYRQEPNQQSRSHYGGRVSLWLTTDSDKISAQSRESDAAARRYAEEEEDDEDDDEIVVPAPAPATVPAQPIEEDPFF